MITAAWALFAVGAVLVGGGLGSPLLAAMDGPLPQRSSLVQPPEDFQREFDRLCGCGETFPDAAPGTYEHAHNVRRLGGDSIGAEDGPADRGPASAGPAASPPPRPPSLAEALATCPQPAPADIGRNPAAEGVTGLETYLWAERQEPLRGGGSVRGHAVSCALTPVRWTWTSGDGASYTRDRPGGPHPDNPVGHVYETKGDYELGLTVVWRAVTSAGTRELTVTSTEPYHVFEIRSVLTG